MFHEFLNTYYLFKKQENDDTKSYLEWKKEATGYQEVKIRLLEQVFQSWVQTPSEYENFT